MENPDHSTNNFFGQAGAEIITHLPAPHKGVLGGMVLPMDPAVAPKGAAAKHFPQPATKTARRNGEFVLGATARLVHRFSPHPPAIESQDHCHTLSLVLGSGSISPQPALRGKRWRGVFFEGPEPDQDREGEEIPVWFVFVGDEEAEPLGKTYKCFSFPQAESLAHRMSEDRHLELIQEAMPA